jgi:flagellar protein FliS
MNHVAKAYQQNRAANAEYAEPHQLITMLFEGAMQRLSAAIGHMERGETARKGECVSRIIGILDHLRGSLDSSVGVAELVDNLDALYEYMMRRVTEANLHNDPAPLREVQGLLRGIAEAWAAIPAKQRESAA